MPTDFIIRHYSSSLSTTKQAPFSTFMPMPQNIKGNRSISTPSAGALGELPSFTPAPPPFNAFGPLEQLVFDLGAAHYFALDGSNDGNDKIGSVTLDTGSGGSITFGGGAGTLPAGGNNFTGSTDFSGNGTLATYLRYLDGLPGIDTSLNSESSFTIISLSNLEGSAFADDGVWQVGDDDENGFRLVAGSTTRLYYEVSGSAESVGNTAGDVGTNDDEWWFVACRFETGSVQLWGRQKDNSETLITNELDLLTEFGGPQSAPAGAFNIGLGGPFGGDGFVGKILGVGAFPTALDWGDIFDLADAAFDDGS